MNWKRKIILFGYFEATGIFFLMLYTFLCAYLNNYHVVIDINHYGEAHVEWFMFCIIFDFVLIGLWFLLKEVKKE